MDRAYTTIKSNEGTVDQLKAQLDQTLIHAPFDGLIGLSPISLGSYLIPGSEIVNLQSLQPIYVDFNLNEAYITHIKLGDKIEMRTPAVQKQVFEGKVYAMESAVDKGSRMITVRASIPNEKHQLLPGTYGEVTLYLDKPQQILLIPQTAVTYSLQGNYVYCLVNQKAVKTPITLGKKFNNNMVIVLKGLDPKDIIIASGQLKLYDGAAVTVIQDTGATASNVKKENTK